MTISFGVEHQHNSLDLWSSRMFPSAFSEVMRRLCTRYRPSTEAGVISTAWLRPTASGRCKPLHPTHLLSTDTRTPEMISYDDLIQYHPKRRRCWTWHVLGEHYVLQPPVIWYKPLASQSVDCEMTCLSVSQSGSDAQPRTIFLPITVVIGPS